MAIEMCVEEYRYRIVHTKNGFVPQRMDMCEMIFHDFIEHGRRIIRAKLEKAQAYIQDMTKEPIDFTTVQVVQALPIEFTEDERIAELKTLLATKKDRTFWLEATAEDVMRFQWQLENVYSWLHSNGVTALRIEEIEIECGLYPTPKLKGKRNNGRS